MGQNILKLIKPADIITLVNAALGFFSIIMAILGDIESALVFILFAVIADGADGAVARYSGFGVLGANLDSLSDAISFGVAPAVLAFISISDQIAAGFFSILFMCCGILRLARFNVSGKKDGFEGIPITAGGFIVALFLLVKDMIPYFQISIVVLLFLLSLLMVSTISYPKIRKNIVLAPAAFVLIFTIAGYFLESHDLLEKGSLLMLIISFLYILSPIWRRT